jgi:general secretion pathway protein G
MVMVCAVVVLLAVVSLPIYRNIIENTRTSRAIADVQAISIMIDNYRLSFGRYPDTLADLQTALPADPWGTAYQYINYANIVGPDPRRTDQFGVPLNINYDLYSMGPDRSSSPPITDAVSRDDIIRANEGRFVGAASHY